MLLFFFVFNRQVYVYILDFINIISVLKYMYDVENISLKLAFPKGSS